MAGDVQEPSGRASWRASVVGLPAAVALSVASGVAYFAAFPGVGWWPLAFVALTPLLVACQGRSALAGAALGLLMGTVATFSGFGWLADTFSIHGGFSPVIAWGLLAVVSIFQGGRFAVFAAFSCALARKQWPAVPAAVAAFAVSEVAYPLIFPWFFGACLHDFPVMIQIADVGGPILVGLPLAITAAALASLTQPSRQRVVRASLLVGGAIALPVAYGLLVTPFVARDIDRAPRVRVGLVQGAIPMPPVTRATLEERFADQIARSRQLVADGADLLIWPESAFTWVLPENRPADVVRDTAAGSLGVPLLTGALLETSDSPPRLYNAAIMLDHHAQMTGRYDKQHLLPFGEYIPLGEQFPVLHRLSPASGRISRGDHAGPLPFEDKRISVLICYEDVLPEYARKLARSHRPHLLVNLTNDGWFGMSHEPAIHLALSKLRAVEHRRYLARATNTGPTGVVDPMGRVMARAPAFGPASVLADARWMHGWTLFGWWGNWPWYLLGAAGLAACFVTCPEGWRER